jgi:hypothetical protein
MPRSGEVGEQIYEQVENLVGEGMTRTEAFSRISEESGRRSGTVAANYYRVARKRGGGQAASRGRRAAGESARAGRGAPARRSRRGAGDGNIDDLADAVVQSVQALAAAVRDQASEVKDLRERLDGVRRLLNA